MTPEAVAALTKLVTEMDQDIEAGVSYAAELKLKTGKKGAAAKKAWLPRHVATLMMNAPFFIDNLLGVIRAREYDLEHNDLVLAAVQEAARRGYEAAAADYRRGAVGDGQIDRKTAREIIQAGATPPTPAETT